MTSLRSVLLSALALPLLAFAACGGDTKASATPRTPKEAIAHQLDRLKAGDVDGVKAMMTERQRDKITPELVEAGKAEAGKYTIDDLVDSVEDGEFEGKKTAKIKMKNGRTLTTLVMTDGVWLADTIWFK